jgi:lipoic acid synthetase
MLKKPSWIATTVDLTSFQDLISKIQGFNLHVVCFEASCPNIGTCFHKKTATFLILGDICTRNCKFCGIKHGLPSAPDLNEPRSVAKLVEELKLRHVVITSVTRDDLPDQGVSQYIQTIREIKKTLPNVVIEVLIPDFQGKEEVLVQLIREKLEIVNHNVETVPRLYPIVRPQANYLRSLEVLRFIKECNPSIYTKSGLMIGIGETKEEVQSLLQDLKQARCDIVTIGQYLQPSERHIPVQKYYSIEEFKEFEQFGKDLEFLFVNAAPLVRSSFNAEEFSKEFL